MFETAFALSLTQFARTLSFPERLQHRPARNAALEPWRLRNTGLDALFYDVRALTAEETFYVSDALASEGLIMIVPPSGGPMLTLCDSVDEYKLRGGRDVHAMAVAGVGGSAIGAAAFARNVADAIGAPVAAVVSGYGLGDIINETMGGSFFFGWLGHMRNDLEVIDDVVGRPRLGAYEDRHKLALKPHPSCLDTDTVETLLADPDLSFTLLAGHSRGNRVLSEALYSIKEEAPKRMRALAPGLKIVTFGGRITMPPDCRDVVDVIGELDWFGEMNSRPQIDSDIRVPLAGHSTNTDFAASLQVTRIIKEILARGATAAEPSSPEAVPAPVEAVVTTLPVAAPAVVSEEVAEPAAAAPLPEVAGTPELAASPEPEAPVAEVDATTSEVVSEEADALAATPVATAAPVETADVPPPSEILAPSAPIRPAPKKSGIAPRGPSRPKGSGRR